MWTLKRQHLCVRFSDKLPRDHTGTGILCDKYSLVA